MGPRFSILYLRFYNMLRGTFRHVLYAKGPSSAQTRLPERQRAYRLARRWHGCVLEVKSLTEACNVVREAPS